MSTRVLYFCMIYMPQYNSRLKFIFLANWDIYVFENCLMISLDNGRSIQTIVHISDDLWTLETHDDDL